MSKRIFKMNYLNEKSELVQEGAWCGTIILENSKFEGVLRTEYSNFIVKTFVIGKISETQNNINIRMFLGVGVNKNLFCGESVGADFNNKKIFVKSEYTVPIQKSSVKFNEIKPTRERINAIILENETIVKESNNMSRELYNFYLELLHNKRNSKINRTAYTFKFMKVLLGTSLVMDQERT